MNEIYDHIQGLARLDQRTDEQDQELLDYQQVLDFMVETAERSGLSLNDRQMTKTVEESANIGPGDETNSFPMALFMDFAEETPYYSVGDLGWVLIEESPESDNYIALEIVIVAKIIDIDGVTYRVAPYSKNMAIAIELDCDFSEAEIYEQNPMKSNHLSLVH